MDRHKDGMTTTFFASAMPHAKCNNNTCDNVYNADDIAEVIVRVHQIEIFNDRCKHCNLALSYNFLFCTL